LEKAAQAGIERRQILGLELVEVVVVLPETAAAWARYCGRPKLTPRALTAPIRMKSRRATPSQQR